MCLISIAIPLFFVFVAIVQQGATFSKDAYHWVTEGGIQALFEHPIVAQILTFINKHLPFDAIDPTEITQKVAQLASQVGTKVVGISAQILGDVTNVLMNFFLMLFVLFFLLRDQDKIISAFRHVLPLSRSQEDRLLTEIEEVSKSAILGSFLTAIAQGNIVRPLLMQGNSGMNTLLIFFSLLGGIHLYGLIGLIYGPIIFALTLVLFNMYETKFKTFLDQQDKN
jgi:predicted PurR-regulated permease PerM